MFFMQQWDINTNVPENMGINFLKSGGTRQMFPAHNQPVWGSFYAGADGVLISIRLCNIWQLSRHNETAFTSPQHKHKHALLILLHSCVCLHHTSCIWFFPDSRLALHPHCRCSAACSVILSTFPALPGWFVFDCITSLVHFLPPFQIWLWIELTLAQFVSKLRLIAYYLSNSASLY